MLDDRQYPALLSHWLTPIYDLFARTVLREKLVKRRLIERARIAPGHRVLDLGCGTGTLAIAIKRMHPSARVTGLDADRKILAIARKKAAHASLDVTFDLGDATVLPYSDGSFDRVVSSLLYSVLSRAGKQSATHEVYRVLAKGGGLFIADFGPPHTPWGRLVARRMRRFEPIASNLDGCLPMMLREAGFRNVGDIGQVSTVLGTISFVGGRKTDC
jgi:ubiquinone/menaquinone biosynthesis C-methylase UbiE